MKLNNNYIPILYNIKIKIYKNSIKIIGPLGTIEKKKAPNLKLLVNNKKIFFLTGNNYFNKNLLLKMMFGVSKGYYSTLLIQGVGYKVFILDHSTIKLKLGFSNDLFYKIPYGIKIYFLEPNKIIIYGSNKQKVTQTAAEIRKLKSPEPYKGKGIRYQNEVIKIKVGKTS